MTLPPSSLGSASAILEALRLTRRPVDLPQPRIPMAAAADPTLSSRAAVAPPVQLAEALVLAAPRLVRAMVARVAWGREQRPQLARVALLGTPVKAAARVTPRFQEVQDKPAQEERLPAVQAALARTHHPALADSSVLR